MSTPTKYNILSCIGIKPTHEAENATAMSSNGIRKVRHREGSPQEGSPQNWKVRHSFERFATNVIRRFATTLHCIIKQ